MKLPFYYSFKEFTDNYNSDLKQWLKENSDKDEIYYLNELYSNKGYKEFNKSTPQYSTIDMSFGRQGIGYEYDIFDFVSIVIGVIEDNFKKKFCLNNENELAEFIYSFEGEFEEFTAHERFWFISNTTYLLMPFLTINKEIRKKKVIYNENNEYVKDEKGNLIFEEGNFPVGEIIFNHDKYNVFLDEMKLISTFILGKIAPEIQEEKQTKSNLTTPEKIVLLEHLGVFARLVKDGVSPENEYRIIYNLIGGSYTNIKKYCLNRKTNNKSSKDYQINEKHKSTIRNFYNSKIY